jgi:hypothetical protein
MPNLSTQMQNWTAYFWGLFILLALVCAGYETSFACSRSSVQLYLKRRQGKVAHSPEFNKFKRTYLFVFILVFCVWCLVIGTDF